MYRKNIKTFLIIILLAVDAALAFLLVRQSKIEVYDKDTLAEVKTILMSGGIDASDDILRTPTADMKIYKSNKSGDMTDKIASLLLAGSISEKYLIPDGYIFYTEAGETLTVREDSSFTYSNGTSAEYVTGTKIIDKNEINDIRKKIAVFFSAEEEEYKENFDFEIEDISGNGSVTSARITQTLDGIKITNNGIYCIFDGEDLIFADGSWCFLPISEKNSAHLFDCVNILFIEKGEIAKETLPQDGTSSDDEIPTHRTVASLTGCYRALGNTEKNEFSFIPFWKIEYSDGTVSFYNALNGEKY